MKDKKVTRNEMKETKGGFNPEFSVSVEADDTRAFPQLFPSCDPPPNTSYKCIMMPQLTKACL